MGLKVSPERHQKQLFESEKQQRHRKVNEKYLKNREQVPSMQMMDRLTESEIDSLTAIKERQVGLVSNQNATMLKILDQERKREIERQQMIRDAPDILTREEMKLRFVLERDHAAKNIKALAKKQRQEIEQFFSSEY